MKIKINHQYFIKLEIEDCCCCLLCVDIKDVKVSNIKKAIEKKLYFMFKSDLLESIEHSKIQLIISDYSWEKLEDKLETVIKKVVKEIGVINKRHKKVSNKIPANKVKTFDLA